MLLKSSIHEISNTNFIRLVVISFLFAEDDMQMDMGKEELSGKVPFYTRMGNRVIYHLYITDTIANYTGSARPAMA